MELKAEPLREIATGYRSMAKKTAVFFIFCAGILAASCAIVYPLWYLASFRKDLFNLLFLVLAASAAGIGIFRRIARTKKAKKTGKPAFARFLKQSLFILTAIAAVYGTALLALSGHTFYASGTGLVLLLAFGFLLHGRH